MREGRKSFTAAIVSLARGFGLKGEIIDPHAETLLGRPLGTVLTLHRRALSLTPLAHQAARWLSFGFADHLALRTFVIDRLVERGREEGITQCVLLGAGLDARAYRLEALRGARVFEVDHPATQSDKLERAEALPPPLAEIVHIAVDFGKDDLVGSLIRGGFDPSERSIIVWEGVTMYLPIEAIRGSLAAIEELAAEGSLLTLSYSVPNPAGSRVGEYIRDGLFRLIEEPMVSYFTRDELAALLREYGFEVFRDGNSRDFAVDAGLHNPLGTIFLGERVAMAKKLPAPHDR
ncbi:MAG: SAM-dependent methyltransferase [Sandaracinaceae bacterium]|nr:SAM-dependent methyltransferase [Sandaracinaceae bacterium]